MNKSFLEAQLKAAKKQRKAAEKNFSEAEKIEVSSVSGDAFRANEISNAAKELTRAKSLEAALKRAVERFKSGDYGFCDECGAEIPEARLQAQPDACMCVSCKEISESRMNKKAGFGGVLRTAV